MTTNFAPEIVKWINHLLKEKQISSALKLLKILSTPKIQKPYQNRDKEVEAIIGKERPTAEPPLKYYYMKELLKKGIEALRQIATYEVTEILSSALEKAILIEYGHLKYKSDHSFIWRPAIEEHQQNSEHSDFKVALLIALRDSTEILANEKRDETKELLKIYISHNYSIFRRLAIHLLRINFNHYKGIANELSSDMSLLRNGEIYHEYYLFLRDNFSKLYKHIQQSIVEAILTYDNGDPKANEELQVKQRRYYWWKHLSFISSCLKGKDKKLFDELQVNSKNEKIMDTSSWHGPVVYGEKPPISVNELKEKNNKEVWDYSTEF